MLQATTREDKSVLLEDVEILFRNFAGQARQYNDAGDRNFCVLLSPEQTERLTREGFNIKTLKPRDEEDAERPYLKVKVGFGGRRPPKISMITSRGRTDVKEDTVEMLDWVDITKADLIINPYHWVQPGKQGVTAYLRSLFVTIEEDALDLKYADVPGVGEVPRTGTDEEG